MDWRCGNDMLRCCQLLFWESSMRSMTTLLALAAGTSMVSSPILAQVQVQPTKTRYRGACATVRGSDPYLGRLTGRVSSIRYIGR